MSKSVVFSLDTLEFDFNNSVKNYQYGSGNDNDFYYFTGISISYIFYRIPCPKNSAPYNSIY